MTDNRTTELLRKLLDERGLSCQTHYLHVSWRVGSKLYNAVDNLDGTLTVDNLTPEQAVAATLGSGTLTAAQVRECVEQPVDADGVPIRCGDVVGGGMGDSGKVQHVELWPDGFVVVYECHPGTFTRYAPDAVRHVKPRTLEVTCGHDCMVPTVQDLPNYCPTCGARIVGRDGE